MTTNTTKFTDWQDGRKPGPPYTTTAPALVSLRDYLLKRWGGQNLGGYGLRPIRGGAAWSSHSFGAAIDWRYANPGPGREVLDMEILPWLLNHSEELGIQAIHDYRGARIWRSKRVGAPGGWLHQRPDQYGMGQAWAEWLHLEVFAEGWNDGRPVEDKIKDALDTPKPTLSFGESGPEVKKLNEHLRFWKCPAGNGTSFTADTRRGVKRLQKKVGVTQSGVWDQRTSDAYRRSLLSLS